MHYKNGRDAKAGDRVVYIDGIQSITGILHSLNAQSTTCNGRIAVPCPTDPWVNIKDCLHTDDINAATIPTLVPPAGTTVPAPEEPGVATVWHDEVGSFWETYGGSIIHRDASGQRFIWNEGPPRRKNPVGADASPIDKRYLTDAEKATAGI